ncbi:uncharacterized protein LOC128736373 [Sabethes cyaneus]|uniref:uncharacterized protein LOC128736373 n=1 Tax=Sabethes cyaneus TaxID=53552 RepID=UPI00237E0AD4|nr:uncharacterized protein LOC128736373 [Sabethes cyaneus]
MSSLNMFNIYATEMDGCDGSNTALQQAIKTGNQDRIDTILKMYEADFERIRTYLVSQYDWEDEDKIWLKKDILIAVNEAQCHAAKQLEIRPLSNEQIRKSIIVLLQGSTSGEEVAVIFPSVNNKLAVFSLITLLIPNGFLSINCFSAYWDYRSLIEEAVVYGNIGLIERLLTLGAKLVHPGHNALLKACECKQKDSVYWLLTKHNDCLMEHMETYRALYLLQRNKEAEMFEFVLDKMVEFRQKRYTESISEAFTNIWVQHFASPTSTIAIMKHLRIGPVRDVIEKCISKYKLNLFKLTNGRPIIRTVLFRGLASNYCYEVIRDNLTSLGMQCLNDNSLLLHYLIYRGHIEFLEEIYAKAPDVRKYFETDIGFTEFQDAIRYANLAQIQFILKYHADFLRKDVNKFRKEIVLHQYDSREFSTSIDVICDLIPEFRENLQDIPNIEKIRSVNSTVARICAEACPQQTQECINNSTAVRSDVDAYLLHKAVSANNGTLVAELLDDGWNIDLEDNQGNAPIHFVQDVDMLELLLKRHNDGLALLNRTNHDGYTVLFTVCCSNMKTNKIQLLERILAKGANVNHLTQKGETVTFMAESCEMLDVFMKHNANLEIVNNKGETAVLRQLLNRNAKVAIALLLSTHILPSFEDHAYKYLAPMVNEDHRFFSTEYQPFLTDHPEILKALLDAVYKHSREEASRNFAAVCFGSINFLVEKFLDFDYDLDFNCRSYFGRIPLLGLFMFVHERNDHLAYRLLQKGANVETRDQRGRTALLMAASNFGSLKRFGHGLAVVQMLLDHGANVNARDENGDTALHLAFNGKNLELVELLVRNGANLKVKNINGRMPCEHGSHAIQELLYFMS